MGSSPASVRFTNEASRVTKALRYSGLLCAANAQDTRDWIPEATRREWKYIVVHHSATTSGSVDSIHEQHRRRKDATGNPWLGIGYHFVIGNGNGMDDGLAEPTFRWKQQLHGAHCGNAHYNGAGIGICLIGNFEDNPPTARQRRSLIRLIRYLSVRYEIGQSAIIGHKSVRPTLCPGKQLKLREVVQQALADLPAL